MQRYATTEELAVRYRVTVETIRTWARRGQIPSVRVGRRPLLFDMDEVDRCVRARARRSGRSGSAVMNAPADQSYAENGTTTNSTSSKIAAETGVSAAGA